MEKAFEDIGSRFARSVIARDLQSARDCLAPWLRADFSVAQLNAILEPRYEGMPEPAQFSLDGNSCSLDDLEPNDYGAPTQPLPSDITKENYRKWMVIEFKPDAEKNTSYDACLDLWMAVVEVEGAMKIGYLEAADPD
jgi:hypothetical protein